jgi:predicted dehydrogenase
MNFLFGAPAEVFGRVKNVAHDIAVEDVATAQFRFESGLDLHFQVSNACAAPKGHTQVVGDNGTLVLSGGVQLGHPSESARAFVAGSEEAWATPEVEWETLEPPELPHKGHAAMYVAFVSAVRDGGTPAVTAEHGRTAVEMLNGILLSSHTGRSVEFPLDRDEYDGLLSDLSEGRWPAS